MVDPTREARPAQPPLSSGRCLFIFIFNHHINMQAFSHYCTIFVITLSTSRPHHRIRCDPHYNAGQSALRQDVFTAIIQIFILSSFAAVQQVEG